MLACLDTRQLGPLADAEGWIRAQLAAYASIQPAVQNLTLAGRPRPRHHAHDADQGVETELRRVVGLPPELHVTALIRLGYPARRFRPTRRRALAEVTSLDRYGQPLPDDD